MSSQTGAQGEGIAVEFLVRKGFKILDRNFRRPWGEIDIIAEKGGSVRFVEVKAICASLSTISREMSYGCFVCYFICLSNFQIKVLLF